jgi:hypothetical protein
MRWRIMLRSNSAKAPVTWNIKRPAGVVVSIDCMIACVRASKSCACFAPIAASPVVKNRLREFKERYARFLPTTVGNLSKLNLLLELRFIL